MHGEMIKIASPNICQLDLTHEKFVPRRVTFFDWKPRLVFFKHGAKDVSLIRSGNYIWIYMSLAVMTVNRIIGKDTAFCWFAWEVGQSTPTSSRSAAKVRDITLTLLRNYSHPKRQCAKGTYEGNFFGQVLENYGIFYWTVVTQHYGAMFILCN